MFAILSEQEPDFSQKVCPGLSIADLDEEAIALMKNRYAQKQNNLSFQTLSTQQVLKDLGLLVNGKLNYAALILLAKKEKIHELLPQCNIVIEYRQSPSMIPYTDRVEIQEPLFLAIDKAWNYINQPAIFVFTQFALNFQYTTTLTVDETQHLHFQRSHFGKVFV